MHLMYKEMMYLSLLLNNLELTSIADYHIRMTVWWEVNWRLLLAMKQHTAYCQKIEMDCLFNETQTLSTIIYKKLNRNRIKHTQLQKMT